VVEMPSRENIEHSANALGARRMEGLRTARSAEAAVDEFRRPLLSDLFLADRRWQSCNSFRWESFCNQSIFVYRA
jgi:hypothetical protein